ncbi:MAG: hypothetical protein ACREVR_17950 [Burkholderiales bacterium]
MKRIVIAAALMALCSGVAFSQTPGDQPAAAPAGGMKEDAKPAPQKEITIVQGPGQSSVKEDARHCLEQSTNTDIIKCAEPYLPVKQKKM